MNIYVVFVCSNWIRTLVAMVNLNFPLTYNGKSENGHLLLSHCRYFDKSFTEMFLEYSFTNFVQIGEFDWLPWQPKG